MTEAFCAIETNQRSLYIFKKSGNKGFHKFVFLERPRVNANIPERGGKPCGQHVCDVNAECMPARDGGVRLNQFFDVIF